MNNNEASVGLIPLLAQVGTGAACRTADTFYFNRRVEELTGYSAAEIRSVDQWFTTLHGKCAPAIRAHYEKQREQGGTAPTIVPIWRKDQSLVFAEISAACQGTHEIWFVHDVTARIDAELARHETEARFRVMAQHAPVILWMSDTTGLFSFFNNALVDFTGLRPSEAQGDGWFAALHPDEAPTVRTRYLDAVGRHQPFVLEHRLRHHDGRYRFMLNRARPRFLDDGRFAGFVGSLADITDRVEAEQLVRASEQRYRATFENSPAGFFHTSLDGRTLRANNALAQILGHHDADSLRREITDIASQIYWNPTDRERVLTAVMASDDWTTHELYLRRRDGTRITTECCLRQVRDAAGNLAYIEGTLIDITARRRAEEAARATTAFNQAVAELSTRLLPLDNLDDACRLILDHARRLTESPLGYVGYLDPKTGWLVCPSIAHAMPQNESRIHGHTVFKQFKGIRGMVLNDRRTVVSNDVAGDPRHTAPMPPQHQPITRFLSAPAVLGDRVFGQIALANAPRDYEQYDVLLIERFAELLAVTIQRMQTQAELRANEESYRLLVEVAPDAILVHDGARVVFANRTAARLLGFASADELTNKAVIDFIHPDHQADFHREETEMHRADTSIPPLIERRLVRRDGTVIDVEISRRPVRYRGTTCVQSFVRDITRRKVLELALLDREAQLRTFIARTPLPMTIIESDDEFLLINDRFTQVFGYTRDDLPTVDHWWRFAGPGQSDADNSTIARRWRETRAHSDTLGIVPQHAETVLRCKDGSARSVELNWTAIGTRLIVTYIDVSERIRAQEALKTAVVAAEDASKAKSEFLASMSHEIRTPMNGIIGMAQVLGLSSLTDDQRSDLECLKLSADSLLAIINDVLDLSKIEAGRIELERTDFSLHRLIDEVTRIHQAAAAAKELTVATTITAETPDHLVGDPLRLRQILLNLVGNAIKFTASGEIRVSACAEERHDNTLLLRVSVTDSGIGIKPEVLDRLFEPFVQADPSIARLYGGTGLGLAICRRLVALMGGKIWVESAEGVGTSFHFRIVVGVNEPRHRHGIPAEQPVAAWHGPTLRVLVVEDELTNRVVAQSMLKSMGHTVDVANDGDTALTLCSSEQYDMVLLDIRMPGIDGRQVAQRIRAAESSSGQHLPILAVTASVVQGERERLLACGFDGFVPKPIDRRHLMAEMLANCRAASSAD